VLINNSNNISGAKSVPFILLASNPGASRIVWFNARTATLCVGNNKLADLATAQMLTNKTLTTPIISINTKTITLLTAITTLVGYDTTDILTNETMTGSTNLVDTSTLQTMGAFVNVSLAIAPATWQPITSITTPETIVANCLIIWRDITGDTLMLASMKMDGTIFKNTNDMNLIVIDRTNAAIRWATTCKCYIRSNKCCHGLQGNEYTYIWFC
jgi:hypothetical protein